MTDPNKEGEAADHNGRTITVYYGETPYDLKPGSYEGSALAAIFLVPAGYVLDLVNEDGVFDDINPNQRIEIRQGMKFASHPPVGRSS